MLSLTLLLACPPVVDTDKDDDTATDTATDTASDTASDTGTDTGDSDTGDTPPPITHTAAAVTTVSDDYASGVLAVIELSTWRVGDSVSTVPPDNTIVGDKGSVYLLGRYGYDLVRVYQGGNLREPTTEFSVGDGANPQDARECGGKLYVTRYGKTELSIYDTGTWLLSGVVDLSGYADSDGIPEMADLVEGPGILYVALQQLDQDNGWVGNGGVVAAIDCSTSTLTDSWDVAPNPSIAAWPGRPDLLVRTGVYYNPDYSLALDGAVSTLNVSTGTVTPIVTEADLGENINGIEMVDGTHGVMLTSNEASEYTAWCINPDSGDTVKLFTTQSYINDMAAGDGDNVWFAARQSWADPSSQGGIITVDAVACVPGSEVWHQETTFAPYAIAFL
jgi:hypothetical protein